MPTYTFTRTREQIATLVLQKIRVLGAGDVAEPEDTDVVNTALDLRLKELHVLGTLWWNVAAATTDVALSSGVATATIAPAAGDYLFPVSMMLRVSTDDNPLEIIGHREYQAIGNKTDEGQPEKVFISGATCRFWPVPQENYTAKLTYEAIAADSETNTAPDMPVEMMRSLVSLLAYDVADAFGVEEGRLQRLALEARRAEDTIKELNAQRVDNTTVTPEWF